MRASGSIVAAAGGGVRALGARGLVVVVLVWCAVGARGGEAATLAMTKGAPVPDKPDALPHELLVRFRPGRALATMGGLEARKGIRVVRSRRCGRTDWHRVQVAPGRSVKELVAEYRKAADVVVAEPNYRVRAFQDQRVPNDPSFGELWGLHNTGQSGGTADADVDAPEAWHRLTASSVLVAVIDSGVDYDHPDLAANIWTNPGEIAGNGVDDDGNGYVDDVVGWDFVNGDNDPMDDHGHGTHCAGTVGAVGNNGLGVAGVCWTVKIMVLKILDETGEGVTSDAIEAIDYATAMGAKVTSNSWGGPDYSVGLRNAIAAADAAGALFVAAAGNDYGSDNDTTPQYPASHDNANIIAVAGTTRTDGLASFSNIGATSVDLGAPGQSIYSAAPGGGYVMKSGTSMATPHVAGACALVWEAGGTSHADVKAAILDSVDVVAALQGKCVTNGRLNLAHAVDVVAVGRRLAVASPNGGEGTESGTLVTIAWTATGDGWEPGDQVALATSADSGNTWSPIAGAQELAYDAGSFVWDTAGLPAGEQYRVRVAFVADSAIHDASNGDFMLTGAFDHFDVAIATPQPNGREVQGTCAVEAKDADGRTITSFGEAQTGGRFPVAFEAPGVAIGGLSGSGELNADDFSDGVADLTALCMTLTVASPPVTVQFTAASADGRAGTSADVVIQKAVDYLTEQFDTSPFDLDGRSVVFVPNGSSNHYAAYTNTITALPTDPSGGTPLVLDDDDYTTITLSGGHSVFFYGTRYTTLYVNSDGNITFNAGDSVTRRTLWRHFNYKRFSVLYDDLYPPGGEVSWKELDDRVAVTYLGVPEFDTTNSNTLQAELFFDGRLAVSYLGIASVDGIAGLSRGTGVPADFSDSDLSAYPPLPPGLGRLHDFPLDTDPGWTRQGGWAFGQPTGGGSGSGDPTSGCTGANVYGYNLDGDYPNGMAATEYLTTPAMDCAGATGVCVSFRRWLGVESAPNDRASFQVSNDGTTWTTVWANPSDGAIAESSWSLQTYDISAVADGQPAVTLRWGMGPTDAAGTQPGWNLDDVELWGSVAEVAVTVQTSPPGLAVLVDGASHESPYSFIAETGSAHTVDVDSPQPPAPAGTRHVFASWSDLGAQSHTIVADGDVTLTASFDTFHELTVSVAPPAAAAAGCSVAAVPAGQDGSWHAAGSTVELSASAAEGWRFDRWDDGGVEPVRVVELAGPVSATAQFVEQPPSEVVLLQLAEGWNLVSTPVEPLDPARDAVFPPAAIAAVWTHGNPGGYTVPDAIHAKRGYWVLATQAVALEIEGVRPSDHTVALTDGWNLIGIVADTPGGSQPVPASAAAVWQYDNPGGYTIPTECAEGKGFWVLVE